MDQSSAGYNPGRGQILRIQPLSCEGPPLRGQPDMGQASGCSRSFGPTRSQKCLTTFATCSHEKPHPVLQGHAQQRLRSPQRQFPGCHGSLPS
eukprot:6465140-Amphidinium_carterae.1